MDSGWGSPRGTRPSGRWASRDDYAAIGNVTNLAARLCAEAQPGQILISQRVYGTIGDLVRVEHVGDVTLKGLPNPVATYNVTGLRE